MADPFVSKMVTINGQKIHYYQAGNKVGERPFILLTGYATTSNFWNKDFVQCLAKDHTVYLLDYAGINSPDKAPTTISIQTMAKGVNSFTAKLRLKKPALIGWSMGGAVALQTSFYAANRYNHLYLLAPVVPTTESGLVNRAKKYGGFSSGDDVLDYVFNRNLFDYNRSELDQYKSQFINNQVIGLFPSIDIIKKQAQAIDQWQMSKNNITKFNNSVVPATFYLPENDAIINQGIALRSIENYPNSMIIMVKNSGHAVSFQKPIPICQNILVQDKK